MKGGDDIDFSQFKDFYKLETKLNINDEAKEDFIKTDQEFSKEFLDTYYLHFSILCVKSFDKLKIVSSTDPIPQKIINFIPMIKKFVNFIVLYNIFVFYFKNPNDKIKDLIISLGEFDISNSFLEILNYIKNSIKNNKDLSTLQLSDKLNNRFDTNTINKLKEFATPVSVIVDDDDDGGVPPPPPPAAVGVASDSSAAAVGVGDLGDGSAAPLPSDVGGPAAPLPSDVGGPHPPPPLGDAVIVGGPDAAAVAPGDAVIVGGPAAPLSSDVGGPHPPPPHGDGVHPSLFVPDRPGDAYLQDDDEDRLDSALRDDSLGGGKNKLLGGYFDASNRYVEVKKRGTDNYYLYDPNYIIPIIEKQDPNFKHNEDNLINKKKEIFKYDKKIIIAVTNNNNYYININDEMFNNDYFESSHLYHKLNFVPKNPNFDIDQIKGGGEIENNQLNYLKISLLNNFFLANQNYLMKIINQIYKFYL